eukprot:scaffold434_cov358-Prasinococcus_capsulatus_cf.AAC.8
MLWLSGALQLVDHVQLVQALLDAWKEELARKPMELSEEEAIKVLGITMEEAKDDAQLKKAYRCAYRFEGKRVRPRHP